MHPSQSTLKKQLFKSLVQEEILERESDDLLRDEEFIKILSKHQTDVIFEVFDSYREKIYINCWHMNDYESFAMWKIYAQNTESIAIQSTFNRLEKCFNSNAFVNIGIVNYIDFNSDFIPINDGILNLFLYKTKFFQYENELRAVIHDTNENDGVLKEVNLNTLIECIYLSPNSPEWFEDLIKSVMDR
jgi:hypothetical protein